MMDAQTCPACGEDGDSCYCPGVLPARRVGPHPHTRSLALLHEGDTTAEDARAALVGTPGGAGRLAYGLLLEKRNRLKSPAHFATFTTDPTTGRLTLVTPHAE